VSTYDDPNREAVGLEPIWTGADTDPTDPIPPGEVEPEPEPEPEFDPSAHTVDEVNSYLAEHPDDSARVLDAERSGKSRVGVLGE